MGISLPRPLLSLLFLAAQTLPLAGGAFTFTIDPSHSYVVSFAADPVETSSDQPLINPIPDAGTVTASIGGSTSETNYSIGLTGFSLGWDQVRTAALLSYSDSVTNIEFTVDEDVPYALSGTHAVSDPYGMGAGFWVALYDQTTSSVLFENRQDSFATANEVFVLGQAGGDSSNILTGSVTGTLLAGHVYRFWLDARIDAYPTDAPGIASASGSVNLTLIPEPSTALLLGTGLAALTVRGKRPKIK